MSEVKVYTTPTCPYCEVLKQFLREKGVDFEAIDVSQDDKAQKYIVEKAGKLEVPIIEIDDKIIVGFDKEKIVKFLNLKD